MRLVKLTCLAVLAVCLFSAGGTSARADEFELTNGRAATGETLLNLFLSGPNFQLDVRAAFAPTLTPFVQGCNGSPSVPCTSGATFYLNSSVDAGAFTFGRAGNVVVNGTTYPPFRFNGGSVNWMGSTIVPTLTAHDEILFSMPFTMSGTMFGTNIVGNLFIPPDPAETVIFSLSFEASGTALVFLTAGHYPDFVNFQITSGSAQFDPVPEPATLILLSSSIAGAAIMRRRRRARRA